MKPALSVAVLGVLMSGTIVNAQDARAPRVSVATTVGPTGVPIAISTGCRPSQQDSKLGMDANGALIVRPWKLLALQLDARLTHTLVGSDCVGVVRIGPTPPDTTYPDSRYDDRILSSTARIGVETPARMPLLRLTIGRGMLWRSSAPKTISLSGDASDTPPRQKYWVVGAAIGTRGRRHVLLEVDHMNMTVDAYETRYTSTPTGVSANSRDIRVSPSWWSIRLGMEWALSK